jgi:hypothetical protein
MPQPPGSCVRAQKRIGSASVPRAITVASLPFQPISNVLSASMMNVVPAAIVSSTSVR